jgi:hypothetical protein
LQKQAKQMANSKCWLAGNSAASLLAGESTITIVTTKINLV